MEEIKKTFVIQWVGPFEFYEEMRDYLKDDSTCRNLLFSFYYFYGSKKGKGHPFDKTDYRYLGIHKQKETPINVRLNRSHEHLSQFREDNTNIWIGSFANPRHQTPENIELAETVFISTYPYILTENEKKKKSQLTGSVCITNLWYKKDETEWSHRKAETRLFDDVLVYENDLKRFSVGNLKPIE